MKNNQLIPGEPLREGVDLIADKKTGALIVVGNSSKLEKISSGGINLTNCNFTPEMLGELAKMDGAIIVDEDVNQILKANVHLNPSDEIQTTQTGTRHRTAHRVSVETALDVIAVSDESGIIKVFSGDDVNELEESSMILGRVNESLQSIDRTRRRFDDSVFELGELEIENSITNQQVLEVIQRGELLGRLSKQVKNAGAIFVGKYTPEAAGDYVVGTNHVLPTMQTARFSSGLSVQTFMKRTSIVECDKSNFNEIAASAITIAEQEGLISHANSLRARLNRKDD